MFFRKRKEAETGLTDLLATLNRRLEDLAPKPEPSGGRLDALERGLEELEGAVEWLTAEVKTLRGKITGGLRRKSDPHEDAPGPTIASGPPPRYSPEWFEAERARLHIKGGNHR